MVVVAIIAILAAIVIPMWTKESRKGKADPEIRAMFSEISVKEESYKSENTAAPVGVYLALPTCPAATSQNGTDLLASACYGAADWAKLRVSPTDQNIRCTYTVTVGTGSPVAAVTALGWAVPAGANFSATSPYYYIVGTCDMDNQGGTNSTFFTGSWDQSVQKQNYGS